MQSSYTCINLKIIIQAVKILEFPSGVSDNSIKSTKKKKGGGACNVDQKLNIKAKKKYKKIKTFRNFLHRIKIQM